jgi:hypothetical protein
MESKQLFAAPSSLWLFAIAVLLATLFVGVCPPGVVVQVLAHGALLGAGAAMVILLRPR